MKLLPTTIEGWTKKKVRFIALLEREQPWTHMADVYENAINYCDRKMLELKGMYRKVLLVVGLILILSIGGCNTARSTLNLGKSIGQDGAWILGKMSDNIQTQEK